MPNTISADELLDKLQIAQLLQNWSAWCDAGDWDNLRTCYTQGGCRRIEGAPA